MAAVELQPTQLFQSADNDSKVTQEGAPQSAGVALTHQTSPASNQQDSAHDPGRQEVPTLVSLVNFLLLTSFDLKATKASERLLILLFAKRIHLSVFALQAVQFSLVRYRTQLFAFQLSKVVDCAKISDLYRPVCGSAFLWDT